MTDPFHLTRFLDAQAESYADAVAELAAGRKSTHWMWFVFPQLRALGRSATAKHFGIGSPDEAAAYLGNDPLGPRLRHCSRLMTGLVGSSAERVLGTVDALKLRSSMTLFAAVAADADDFEAVLDQYYGGERDDETIRLLRRS